LNAHSRLQVALVAGEASGDALAAGVMAELRARVPEVDFYGVAGDRMVAAGCEAWFRAEGLSLIGLTEIVRHVPRLYLMRRALLKRIAARPPDVFIGIDTPAFNIPIEARLRRLGIPTVQYVSPQVWAWRQSRVATIREATDLVLCILPFETAFYEANGVNARFVGHPMADEIPFVVDRAAARESLGLPQAGTLLALLPGSRPSEVGQLSRPFLEAAAWLRMQGHPVEVVVALASAAIEDVYRHATDDIELTPPPRLITGRAREIIAAADLVLAASGTATLETALLKRPMVVAYRISPLTLKLARVMGLGRLSYYSLPNLLAGRRIVPELVQQQVRGELLGAALREFLDGRPPEPDWYDAFTRIHRELRCDASAQAATAILDLLAARSTTTKF
jgi:lipid-A-disaccharide synthase